PSRSKPARSGAPPRPPPRAARRRGGASEHFVTLQRDVELALEFRFLGDFQPDRRARRESDRSRKIAERSIAVGDPESGDVENRLALKFTACRSEEHTSELQSRFDLVCRLLLEKKKKKQ